MASGCYTKGIEDVLKNNTDLDSSDMRIMLVKDTYTYSVGHTFVDDGTSNDPASHELTVTGYARIALANEAVGISGSSVYFDANDVSWASLAAGETIGGAVIFRHTGTDTTAPLLVYIQLGPKATDGGALNIGFAGTGIFFINL